MLISIYDVDRSNLQSQQPHFHDQDGLKVIEILEANITKNKLLLQRICHLDNYFDLLLVQVKIIYSILKVIYMIHIHI